MDLERAAVEAAEHGTHVAVAFIDIDEFGKFNKAFGQDVGDPVPVTIARVELLLAGPGGPQARASVAGARRRDRCRLYCYWR